MRLNQLHHRMPPLRAPILTEMVVSASMASVLMRCCSSHNRSRDGLLIRTICMRRMHHMRGGAGDVTGGLLTAALTASTHHANRPWQRSLAVLAMRWQPELLLVSGCSGHADWSRPSADAAGSCSYLSDCMSLSAYRHLLRAHWAVDWRTHGLDTRQSAVAAKTWAASTCHSMAARGAAVG